MEEVVEFGFERRKEDQPLRVGRERAEIMTPQENAAWSLNKALQNFPQFSSAERQNLQDEFFNLESLRYMNMQALAATLAFLKIYPQPTPDDFKNKSILPIIEVILPEKSMDDKKIISGYKAQFLKYIRAINTFRELE